MLTVLRRRIRAAVGSARENSPSYLPQLRIENPEAAAALRADNSLDWYHCIDVGDHVTAGRKNPVLWNMVCHFLQKHRNAIEDKVVLELGPADGLWSCWLKKLGCKGIVATDRRNFKTYRLIVETFGLPVSYHPNVVSGSTPRFIRQKFGLVASLGVLYHLHEPMSSMVMYHLYLEPGGCLMVETACIEESTPALYHTADGSILPREGNNHFVPTTGFMRGVLDQLGHELIDSDFVFVRRVKKLRRDFGRAIYLSRPSGEVKIASLPALERQLGFGEQGPDLFGSAISGCCE